MVKQTTCVCWKIYYLQVDFFLINIEQKEIEVSLAFVKYVQIR